MGQGSWIERSPPYADPRDIVPLEYDLREQLRVVRDPASSLLEAVVEEQRIPAVRQLRGFDAVVFFDHESMVLHFPLRLGSG